MNPKPFASLNHFTVPVATDKTPPTNWGQPAPSTAAIGGTPGHFGRASGLHLRPHFRFSERLAGYEKSRRLISSGVNTLPRGLRQPSGNIESIGQAARDVKRKISHALLVRTGTGYAVAEHGAHSRPRPRGPAPGHARPGTQADPRRLPRGAAHQAPPARAARRRSQEVHAAVLSHGRVGVPVWRAHHRHS